MTHPITNIPYTCRVYNLSVCVLVVEDGPFCEDYTAYTLEITSFRTTNLRISGSVAIVGVAQNMGRPPNTLPKTNIFTPKNGWLED